MMVTGKRKTMRKWKAGDEKMNEMVRKEKSRAKKKRLN